MKIRVADLIVKYLDFIGITHVFGMVGLSSEDIYDAIYRHGGKIKGIVAKNEYNACCMANGYSRITNKLGVVLTTAGGAALNIIPSLGEEYTDNDPVLAIVGQPFSNAEGKGVFQDTSGINGAIDGEKLFSCVASKYIYKPSCIEEVPNALFEAVEAAMSQPTGTAVLLLNKNIQEATLDYDIAFQHPAPKKLIPTHQQLAILDEVLQKLSHAEKPLKCCLMLGREVIQTESQQLVTQLAEKLQAGVVVAPDAKSAFNNKHPCFMGVTGIACHSAVAECVKDAGLMIIIGTRLPGLSFVDIEGNLKNKTIIYIATLPPYDYSKISNNECVILEADPYETLKHFIEYLNSFPLKTISNLKNVASQYLEPLFFKGGSEFNFKTTLQLFSLYIKENDNVFVDAGNTGSALLHYLPAPSLGYFDIELGMGGMGLSVGSGIGAAFASGKKTYIFMGDGAFLLTGLELHTAIEHNLPVVFVIFNNNSHGMCYTGERLYFKGDYTFNLFKQSFYGKGLKAMFPSLELSEDISDLNTLEKCLAQCAQISTPVVLSLNVDPEEVPPFLPLVQEFRNKMKYDRQI